MTIREYALQHDMSTQAIYKRLSKRGLKVVNLCNEDKTLTEQGIELLNELLGMGSVTNQEAPAANQLQTVVNRVEELEKLLTEAEHRAELAEQRAAAAEGERDYLREQLASSIKATALASAPRLIEDGRKTVKNRLVSAWKAWRT